MVRPVRLFVLAKGLHRPTLWRLPGIRPVLALCVEGSGRSYKTKDRRYHANVSLGHLLYRPNLRSKHPIAGCGVLDSGCSPLRLVRFFLVSEDPVRYKSLKRVFDFVITRIVMITWKERRCFMSGEKLMTIEVCSEQCRARWRRLQGRRRLPTSLSQCPTTDAVFFMYDNEFYIFTQQIVWYTSRHV